MVLVLDNYDSFTYNLVQYLGELKADVLVYRNDEVTVEQIESDRLQYLGSAVWFAGQMRRWVIQFQR